MPVTKSAAKAARQNLRRYKRNLSLKRRVKSEIKTLLTAIEKSDTKTVAEKLKSTQSTLDKAAKNNVIHKNKAARQKSQLAKMVSSGKPPASKAVKTTKKAESPPKTSSPEPKEPKTP